MRAIPLSLLFFATTALAASDSDGGRDRLAGSRIGVLPSLTAEGEIIGLRTVDEAAVTALSTNAAASTVIPPDSLWTSWREARCEGLDAPCVREFMMKEGLDGLVAMTLVQAPKGVRLRLSYLDGASGVVVDEDEALLPSDGEKVPAETERRIVALVSAVRAHGTLLVTSIDAGAELALDGVGIGGTPMEHPLRWVPAGTHALRADYPDGRHFEREIEVEPGADVIVEMSKVDDGEPAVADVSSLEDSPRSALGQDPVHDARLAVMWAGVSVGAAGIVCLSIAGTVWLTAVLDYSDNQRWDGAYRLFTPTAEASQVMSFAFPTLVGTGLSATAVGAATAAVALWLDREGE